MPPHGGPNVTGGDCSCAEIWMLMSIALPLALSSILGLITFRVVHFQVLTLQ